MSPRLVAYILAASTLALPATAADVTDRQAHALEQQIRTWLTSTLGTQVKLSERPIQIEPKGDQYRMTLPITGGGTAISATARPLDSGIWALDQVAFSLPAHFTVMQPLPPKEGEPQKPRPVTYTVDALAQEGHAVWDPSFRTASTISLSTTGLRSEAVGDGLHQTTTLESSKSTSTLQPAEPGRVDLQSDGSGDAYSLVSEGGPLGPIHVTMQRIQANATLTGLSRVRGVEALRALISMALSAPATPEAGEPKSGRPPMDMVAVRALLESLRDAASAMTVNETAEGFAVSVGAFNLAADTARFGMDIKTVKGVLETRMDVGVEGIAPQDGVFAALVPRSVTLRPVFTGAATKDLLDYALAGTVPGSPNQALLKALFSHGGLDAGLESASVVLGDTTLTAVGSVHFAAPAQQTATAEITAVNFDNLVRTATALPMAQQAMPVLLLIKGLGRSVGEKLVWSVAYQAGRVSVNGTDLSALTGAGPKKSP